MVILENEFLHVEIDETGAEIRKAVCEGKSRMWTGDEKYWKGVSPVLFPICSRLPEGKYTYDGKEYFMDMHGFASKQMFTLEKQTPISATFLLVDNAETFKQYPWHFEFRVTYTLRATAIEVTYDTRNTSDSVMYYSVGAHESYYCDGGIENYDVIFERNETLYNCTSALTREESIMLKNSNILPLYENYFKVDSIIFKDHKSRFVTLRNRKTGDEASLRFEGFDYLLLWHKPGAEYICIEPWAGICPVKGAGYDITEKEGMLTLEPGEKQVLKHTVFYAN